MTKTEWRRKLLERRAKLADKAQKSMKICAHLRSLVEARKDKRVFAYSAFGDEVSLDLLFSVFPQMCWALPRVVGHDHMEFFRWKLGDDLQVNRWGIGEPLPKNRLVPSAGDLVIIPCLGIDLKGARLGYGGGFYDRYFENMPEIVKMGTVFSAQRIDRFPVEDHDLVLNGCVDEEGITNFIG